MIRFGGSFHFANNSHYQSLYSPFLMLTSPWLQPPFFPPSPWPRDLKRFLVPKTNFTVFQQRLFREDQSDSERFSGTRMRDPRDGKGPQGVGCGFWRFVPLGVNIPWWGEYWNWKKIPMSTAESALSDTEDSLTRKRLVEDWHAGHGPLSSLDHHFLDFP